MSETLFCEDFDGNGVGFNGPVFESWSIGGVPVAAGHWGLFYPDINQGENLTPGSGRYAGVHSSSMEFIDSLVWLISPLIDTGEYRKMILSADVHFRSNGLGSGEDTVAVWILPVGYEPQKIGIIGETMSAADLPISENMSWDFTHTQGGLVQIAFAWYSSMGPPQYDSIQLDNICLEGFALSAEK